VSTPADVGKQVSDRFHLVNGLPATTLVLFVGLAGLSGGFTGQASFDRLRQELEATSLVEIGLAAFAVLLVALVSNSFQTKLVKILEGYWKPTGLRGRFLERGLALHDARRLKFGVNQTDQWKPNWWQNAWLDRLPAERRAEMRMRHQEWAREQYVFYPRRPSDSEFAEAEEGEILDRLMPTQLGNALRHAEDFAGQRFGLDAIQVVPYLIDIAEPNMVELVEDARTELDVSVKFVFVWFVCSIVGVVAFFDDGPWLLAPLAAFILGWLSYRGAVSAAQGYGLSLVQLVDLYRFDLMVKLHWPLPADLHWETEYNMAIWRQLEGRATRSDRRLPYHHGPT
jgi:hypothetical protein